MKLVRRCIRDAGSVHYSVALRGAHDQACNLSRKLVLSGDMTALPAGAAAAGPMHHKRVLHREGAGGKRVSACW